MDLLNILDSFLIGIDRWGARKMMMIESEGSFGGFIFSNEFMNDRLKVHDNKDKKKLIYIATVRSSANLEWFVLDAHTGITLPVDRVPRLSNLNTYPSFLLNLRGYTITMLESNIYFIGGYLHEDDAVHSDKVFVYNVASGRWILDSPVMKESRAYPTVVTFNRKIYVFGFDTYSVDDDKSLSSECWGEVYSADSHAWTYLECDHPLELVDRKRHLQIESHAVHESRRVVVFWVPCAGVYLFNFDSQRWSRLGQPVSDGPRWSTKVAILQDYLFWHYFGNIYVYDFKDKETLLLYTLPDASQFGEPVGLDGYPSPSFLVGVGNKLHLFWYRPSNLVECRLFTIQFSLDSRTLSLSLADSQFFHTEGYQIQTVLAM